MPWITSKEVNCEQNNLKLLTDFNDHSMKRWRRNRCLHLGHVLAFYAWPTKDESQGALIIKQPVLCVPVWPLPYTTGTGTLHSYFEDQQPPLKEARKLEHLLPHTNMHKVVLSLNELLSWGLPSLFQFFVFSVFSEIWSNIQVLHNFKHLGVNYILIHVTTTKFYSSIYRKRRNAFTHHWTAASLEIFCHLCMWVWSLTPAWMFCVGGACFLLRPDTRAFSLDALWCHSQAFLVIVQELSVCCCDFFCVWGESLILSLCGSETCCPSLRAVNCCSTIWVLIVNTFSRNKNTFIIPQWGNGSVQQWHTEKKKRRTKK